MTRLLRSRWLPGALVALATFAVFARAMGNGFVNWDDDANFLSNPNYRGLGWANLSWMFTSAHTGPYVPIAWVTLGLDYLLWGLQPWGYHLTSVLLHTVNAVLCWLVARRLLAAGFRTDPAEGVAIEVGAVIAALVFALHPLRVESVAWVTERRDVVSGVFALLTVLVYLRAVEAGGGLRVDGARLSAAVALFGLALLSKSIVVGLPAVLLALDVHPLRRLSAPTGGAHPAARSSLIRLVLEKLPFVALSLAFIVLVLRVYSARGSLTSLAALDSAQRLAITAYGLVFYLWKTVAPWPLSPIYPLVQPLDPWSVRYAGPGALVALATAGFLLAARRWPAGLVAWVSYVALLLPVLGPFHNGAQIAADRYTYLACTPWALLAGAGVTWSVTAAARGPAAPRVARIVVVGAVLVTLMLALLTVRQIGVWQDSVTLWRHATVAEPESDIPVFYLGWSLAAEGRSAEAREHFTRSLDRVAPGPTPLRAQLLLHRGLVAERAGDRAAAEWDLRGVLALDPGHPVALIRLGTLLAGRGDRAAAAAAYDRAARRLPAWAEYQVWELRAAVDEMPADERQARAALELGLGVTLQRHGALEEAEARYRHAVSLAPRQAMAWNNLGVTYAQRGLDGEAMDAFVQALRLEPGQREACRNGRRLAEVARLARSELAGCAEGSRP